MRHVTAVALDERTLSVQDGPASVIQAYDRRVSLGEFSLSGSTGR